MWDKVRIGMLIGASLVLLASADAGAALTVLPAGSTVDGKTIGQYTGEAWQAIVGTAATENGVLGSDGSVVFINGSAGTPANRTFSVPEGKYLLVPLLVGEQSQLELGFDKSAAQVRAAAKDQANAIDELHAKIDGQDVPNLFDHREASPDFSFTSVAGNSGGVPPGDSGIAVADGYWLLLAPPTPGTTFTINFGGGISAFGFAVDVTDTITVVPEPGSLAAIGASALMLIRRRRASLE